MRTKHPFLHEVKRKRGLFLLMLPGVIYLIINNYIPMAGIIIAFKKIQYSTSFFDTYIKSPWNGLKNFEFFTQTNDAFIITRNTVLYNVCFIFLGLVLSVTFAILLNEVRSKKAAKIFQSAMILPHFLSWVVISNIVYAFLADKGFANMVLQTLGLEKIAFYSELKFWPFLLILSNEWVAVGVSSVIYLAAITGIDGEYFESAMMDGASKAQQIFKITIPMIKPTIITMTTLALGSIFSANFGLFYNVPRESGILFDVTNVLDTFVFRTLRTGGNTEMAAAVGFYQAIVGFCLVLTANLVIKKFSKENALF